MRASRKSANRPNWLKVFGIPMLIGLASAAGLMFALLLGDAGRIFCWFAVGLPIVLVIWFAIHRQRTFDR